MRDGPYSSLILPVDHRGVGSASGHPDRVGAEVPGFRDPASGIVLGARAGVGTPVHNHCLVDRGDSRISHLPNRPIFQPLWGLVASSQRPVAAVTLAETDYRVQGSRHHFLITGSSTLVLHWPQRQTLRGQSVLYSCAG